MIVTLQSRLEVTRATTSLLLLLASVWWSSTLGLLAIPGVLVLLRRPLKSTRSMIWWSVGLIVGHLWWVAVLAHQHMGATIIKSLCLYLLCIGWFGLGAVCYWGAVRSLTRWVVLQPLILYGFFFVMSNLTLPFLSGIKGYPFFNPVLPLISWLQPGSALHPFEWSDVDGAKKCAVCYLPPPTAAPGQSGQRSRAWYAQKMYLALNRVPSGAGACSCKNMPHIIVSSESAFPFTITELEELSLWRSMLQENNFFLFGGMQKNGKKFEQTSFLLSKIPITHRFIKKKCVDFFEFCDASNIFHRFLNNFMDWKMNNIVPGGPDQPASCVLQGIKIKPLLCADVLHQKGGWLDFIKRVLFGSEDNEIIFVLINESWFLPWVQKLWWATCVWHCWGRATVIVGHTGARALSFV